MCTATFLPLANNGFILTSNRDEQEARPTIAPAWHTVFQQAVLFPRDERAGGTWIAGTKAFSLCLLNGAFEKHQHRANYRRSRGLILLDFFEKESAESFETMDFSGIEPFTLLILEHSPLRMTELRWDEQQVHRTMIDVTRPQIWSSAMLYSAAVRQQRQQWFSEWLQQHRHYDEQSILHFHHFGGKHDHTNALVMERKAYALRTVSITQIIQQEEGLRMKYEDLLSDQLSEYSY